MIRSHRYTITHALAASAALGVLVFSQGFAKFWQQFVHGGNQVMSPQVVLQNLLMSTLLFGSLLIILWGSTFFSKNERMNAHVQSRTGADIDCGAGDAVQAGCGAVTGCGHDCGAGDAAQAGRMAAVRLAAKAAPFLTAAALGLNWLGSSAIEWLTQVKPADQELVKCFADGNYSLGVKILMIAAVLFQAPLLEEPIFRGVVFRGFAKSMPIWAAVALSGFLFALIHVNAASFVALWFLGSAFAALYCRTGSILAPMTAHFLFNAVNLALLFFS